MGNQSANMKAIRVGDRSRILGLNTIGFLVVALAAYFSAVITMGYAMNRISTLKAAVLIGLAVTYLVNGAYGYAWARNAAGSPFPRSDRTSYPLFRTNLRNLRNLWI